MIEGFIKLQRKLTQWEWYDDIPTKVLFLHLLLTVNWKDKKWRGVEIKRGQILTGVPTLAEQTNLSQMQVRRALSNLTDTKEINRQTTSRYSIITLNNYNEYQKNNSQTTGITTDEQQTDNTQATGKQQLLKKDKEDKESKISTKENFPEISSQSKANGLSTFLNSSQFEEFWELYPKKTSKPVALNLWNDVVKNPDEVLEKFKQALVWQKDDKSCFETEPQYQPTPAKYIEGERWNDVKPKTVKKHRGTFTVNP